MMETTKQINSLKNDLSSSLKGENEHKLFDFLFVKPTLDINSVQKSLQISKATANKLVNSFVEKGLLIQTNKTKRYKKFLFKKYMDIIEAGL